MRSRQTILLVVALACVFASTAHAFKYIDELKKYEKLGYNIRETLFGWRDVVRESEELFEHIVHGGEIDIADLLSSPSLYQNFLTRMNNIQKQGPEAIQEGILNCSVGYEKNFFKFAAWPQGSIGQGLPQKQTIYLETLPDDCWGQVRVDFTLTGADSYDLELTPALLRDTTFQNCASTFMIGSTRSLGYPITLRKPYKTSIVAAGAEKMNAINNFGLHLYRMCDSAKHLIPDLWMTLLLFIGGTSTNPDKPFFGSKPAPWQEVLNPQFIQAGNGYVWRERSPATFVDLDETQVHSGDFLIVTRMDGVDQLIHWGAGSVAGHSVVLLEFDGEMYAIESQDGWYWPKHGIQRNPWKQWKQWAINAGFNVAVLPLSDEMRAKFNVDAAAEFFKSLEGYPYGYHNFIFGWIDKPSENIPPVTTLEFLYVLLSALQRVIPAPITSFVGEALNKRLGTTGLNLY
jgi:hypothetical protein